MSHSIVVSAHSTEPASLCPLPGGAVSAGSDLLTADRLLLHRLSHSVRHMPISTRLHHTNHLWGSPTVGQGPLVAHRVTAGGQNLVPDLCLTDLLHILLLVVSD